jgi:2-polyprenyl-6-methoxyphenol hydroxylase-like FAD-dependent oxidoreductase
MSKQKTVIVGAGPVGALAALYAAGRGHEVEVYELRGGMSQSLYCLLFSCSSQVQLII